MVKMMLSIGNKIDVARLMKTKDGEDTPVLSSKVLDLLDETTIIMSMPMEKTVTVPLEVSERVNLFFYTTACILSASAIVVERFFEGLLPVVKMKLTSELEKLQRREYFRLTCLLPIHFHPLSEEEINQIMEFKGSDRLTLRKLQIYLDSIAREEVEWKEGTILDLSGGGIRFVTENHLKKNGPALIVVHIQNGEESIGFRALIRLISVEEKREMRGKYEVRSRFYKMQDIVRDAIVKYVFDEERRRRNKTGGERD